MPAPNNVMLWKSVKFWLWLEIHFPVLEIGLPRNSLLPELENETPERERVFHGAQGSQGAQGVQEGPCGPEPITEPICFDILSFSSEFELNAIPSATVSVAIGRRADDVSQAAEIHNYINELTLQLKAQVWAVATSTVSESLDEEGPFWPENKFLMFDGYATGSGFRRNQGGAELTIALTHWLADLNFSSALSEQSHPLNPAQIYFPANYSLDENLATGGFLVATGPSQTGISLAMPFFSNTAILLEDFWGGLPSVGPQHTQGGLKDWLTFIAAQDRIAAPYIRLLAGGTGTSYMEPDKNFQGCRALQRFEPNAVYNGVEEEGYVLGTQIRFPTNPDIEVYIAQAIGMQVGMETLDTYTTGTLWDKLAGVFHSEYMFSVVPLIEKALVVPFVPGITDGGEDGIVHRIIRTTQYESIDLSALMPRPLRAIGLMIGMKDATGGGLSLDQQPTMNSFGGWWDKLVESDDARFKEGLIMFQHAPRWLTGVVDHWNMVSGSTGMGGTVKTATAPTAGAPQAGNTPVQILNFVRPVANNFAHALYIHEILKGRQGIITGPVRFDIAPGSNIKVEASEDKFVKDLLHAEPIGDSPFKWCDEDYYTFFYCAVLRVSTTIDCQNNKAFTSFYVGHIRSESENVQAGTSIEAHPVWSGTRWGGCVMVQDDAFTPLATAEELS